MKVLSYAIRVDFKEPRLLLRVLRDIDDLRFVGDPELFERHRGFEAIGSS